MIYLYNNHCIDYNKKFFCIYIFNYDSDLIFKNQRTRKYDNSSKIQFY